MSITFEKELARKVVSKGKKTRLNGRVKIKIIYNFDDV